MCVTRLCVFYQAQKDAGECHIKIPVITFDSPEEEKQEEEEEEEDEVEEGEEATGSEEDPTLRQTTSQSEEFHLCRETVSSECSDADQKNVGLHMASDGMPSPQLTNDNSSSGIDVRSHPDDTDPLEPNVDLHGFLRLPPALARCGPGGRTHIRGLSMDSGKDAVLLSDRSHNTVCRLF